MAETLATYDFLGPPTKAGDLGTLAHYRVIDELGKGGMGYVFRAEDSKLQRSVALKVMNQKIAATANSRRRFLHEARAMAAVHHDNVATIFEVGESGGTPFMAMEMLKGGTLETFNKEKRCLGYETIIEYARQIARGLAAAHAKGIVHRDIKPANIWIEDHNERIKILDFGLALASTPVDHLSGRGAVIGTPGYLSPEQARSEPLDDRSDLYSLGVVLYELATGQLPLQAGSVSGQLIAILAHRPTPIDELNPEIPKPLCDLIHRLLRKEPRMRPQSAVDLVAELEQVRIDCDAKSEVAQAISKLQVGLTQVVNKSEAGSILDAMDEFPNTISDPLAGIPTSATPAVSAANSGRFVVPKQPPTKVATGPDWRVYGPLLVSVLGIITLLLAATFFFHRIGRSTDPFVVKPDSEASGLPGVGSNASRPSGAQRALDAQRRAREIFENREEETAAAEAEVAEEPVEFVAVTADPIVETPDVEPESSPDETPGEPTVAPEAATPEATTLEPATPADPVPAVDPSPGPEVEKKPEEKENVPEPKFSNTYIATNVGRGADVTVRKGAGENFDDKPIISVWTRNEIEIEHTYLRFDLQSIGSVKKKVDEVTLVLTNSGERPVGSVIRVHGVAKPKFALWPEQKLTWILSYSDKGLADFPVLVTQTVEKENGADPTKVLLTSPALTKFIADSDNDLITLILAGASAEGKEKVEFFSKEKSPKHAPRLRIHAPEPEVESKPEAEEVSQAKEQDVVGASKSGAALAAERAAKKAERQKKKLDQDRNQ